MNQSYQTFIVHQTDENSYQGVSELTNTNTLPHNDVIIRVRYSALNHKDALAIGGHKGIIPQYPHTPGIDASGVVAYSNHPDYQPGDKVIVTGFDLGMKTPGGFAQYISVPAEWIVPLPKKLTLRESMILGTAGFTAALAVWKLQKSGQHPSAGPILVTGATGGVGSFAIEILTKTGYTVWALTNKQDQSSILKKLGAEKIIERNSLTSTYKKPLTSPRWAGAIDTLGGDILANIMKACYPEGNIAVCGNAFSSNLDTTLFPLILNGISLLGIDSTKFPIKTRNIIWNKLSLNWKPNHMESYTHSITLKELNQTSKNMLQGKTSGRYLVTLP